MSNPQSKVFLITGANSGFGRALAEAALADGHRVVGTVRNRDALETFNRLDPERALGKLLDVTDTDAVPRVVAEIEADFGPIGVLVNNAGYGHEGLLEESTLDQLRQQFDVNVFGAVAMMHAVLPFMRKRRAGHILNVTSMGGIITFPGLGIYHGSKFALEGISEALAKEVKSLGIAVTAVEPGAFRTDWAGRSLVRAERKIADYDEVFNPIRERRRKLDGNQPGDPAKAAQAMLKLVASENPPMHLLLGRDAVTLVRAKLSALKAEIDAWEVVSVSTDFQ
ncbi:oxidoreductase [Trinickia violacea]|uniref:Oxidoreductase n=1 Tax=Trinickia violacea TaxID=2571746 RepID=A0A4P8IUG9_9BURK|nr:oxidoreductase [Trinickia violacea]QCP52918.1 oxidoreductase [Trinickia violacea]